MLGASGIDDRTAETNGLEAAKRKESPADPGQHESVDISHLAALSWAEYRFPICRAEERAKLLQSVMDSLRYAILTDMFRVRMEARRVLALMRFNDGDYDGALEHASQALSAATRFGFALRKISLRILAQILVRRGDPISGNAMLERASRIADRLGYQRAVEKAHRVPWSST